MKNILLLAFVLVVMSCENDILDDNYSFEFKLSSPKTSIKVGEKLVIKAVTTGADTVEYTWYIDKYTVRTDNQKPYTVDSLVFSQSTAGVYQVVCDATSHSRYISDTLTINVSK